MLEFTHHAHPVLIQELLIPTSVHHITLIFNLCKMYTIATKKKKPRIKRNNSNH